MRFRARVSLRAPPRLQVAIRPLGFDFPNDRPHTTSLRTLPAPPHLPRPPASFRRSLGGARLASSEAAWNSPTPRATVLHTPYTNFSKLLTSLGSVAFFGALLLCFLLFFSSGSSTSFKGAQRSTPNSFNISLQTRDTGAKGPRLRKQTQPMFSFEDFFFSSAVAGKAGLHSTSHPPALSQKPPCTSAACSQTLRTRALCARGAQNPLSFGYRVLVLARLWL